MDQVTAISAFVLAFALMLPALTRLLSRWPRLFTAAKYAILAVYVLANLYETILFRPVKPGMTAEFELLWSYREALNIADGLAVSDMELLVEILLNVLLYIPMGYLLPFVWPGLRPKRGRRLVSGRIVAIGFACSVLTELAQLIFRIGLFEFDDMLNNTLGCLIGCVLYEIIQRRHDKREHAPE